MVFKVCYLRGCVRTLLHTAQHECSALRCVLCGLERRTGRADVRLRVGWLCRLQKIPADVSAREFARFVNGNGFVN